MAHETCGHEERTSLAGRLVLRVRCIRKAEHEGEHTMPLNRADLLWPNEQGEVTDGVAEDEQAGEPGQAVAPASGAGDRS